MLEYRHRLSVFVRTKPEFHRALVAHRVSYLSDIQPLILAFQQGEETQRSNSKEGFIRCERRELYLALIEIRTMKRNGRHHPCEF